MTAPLVFHPIYSQLPLPPRHRFPIEKYQGIYDALVARGVPHTQFSTPTAVSEAQLCHYFSSAYVKPLLAGSLDAKAMRRIGFPWSEQLIQRSLTAVGGTLLTAGLAVQHGLSLNLTGGYHHAFADYGSGFCLFNDLYLAAQQMLTTPGLDRVLIIDLDVHQGDGTASLAMNNPHIITLSIHGEKNFPYRKQTSDIDIGLPSGCEDNDYLDVLDETLHLAFMQYQPDAVIYDAGVDIHVNDDLGLLRVSTAGLYQRDDMVITECRRRQLPTACVIGGGYQRDISALVEAHLQLFRAAGVYQNEVTRLVKG